MLTRHSGLIVIDFDDVEDVEQCKRALAALPCVALVFISPSGKGVKPFVAVDPIPANDAEHKVAFQAVERFLQDQGLPAKLTKEGANETVGKRTSRAFVTLLGIPKPFPNGPSPSLSYGIGRTSSNQPLHPLPPAVPAARHGFLQPWLP